ncbi:MAG: FtsK/SpoIIIE domain-containing protein [Labedaea sp.]
MTTTTLVATPDPEDNPMDGKILDFPAAREAASPADPGTALEPVGLDAEILDESGTGERVAVDPPGPVEDRSIEARMRAALEAKRRPVIVPWLRSWTEFTKTAQWAAGHVGHTTAYHAVRSPLYALRLVLRSPGGLLRVIAVTGTWAFDLEGAPLRHLAVAKGDAEQYLKLANERRDRVRGRVWLAVLALALLGMGGLVLSTWGPWWAQWATLIAAAGVLGWLGTPADKRIAGRAVVSTKVAKLTSDVVVRALSALGLAEVNKAVGKGGTGITFPAPIVRDGPGWRAEVDLPFGVTVSDVMERRAKLASGLRRPVGCVWPEPAHDAHAGRLVLWVGDLDMSRTKPDPGPLAKAVRQDLFTPAPFGTDQRGRPVGVDLMYSNVLIGAMPGAGKTFALRVLILAAALDPTAQLRIFELKGSGDLSPLEPVAHHYASGPGDDTIEAAVMSLREVYRDLERRAKTISTLPREVCPENKVTPDLAANRRLGLFPLVVAIDECQELFAHPEFGKEAGELCTAIIKRGRALGVILLLATQRPDKASLPTAISANVGVRYCLRVMGQLENDMILGTSMYQNGIRATTFTPRDKGIGYLVGASDDPQVLRGAYLDSPAAVAIVARARALREHAGTLSGHAIGALTEHEQAVLRATVLDDVAAVFAAGEDRLWSEVIVAKLSELRPDTYRDWTPHALAAALKPYGVAPKQVPGIDEDGTERNRRGYLRDAITTARAAHRPTPDVDGA